ncbi:MAG: hypothetical protein K9K64_09480 [Desulfohalobiaceae bacterium]|nr:hypothetical protein [Desulfohalobiaceae bacterium]
MNQSPQAGQTPQGPPDRTYEAPARFVKGFYLLLMLWSLFCLFLLHQILQNLSLDPLYGLLMIVFILVFMWYFSLAFAYRIDVWRDGTMRMTSYRRTISVKAQDIPKALAPRFPVGFLKFRLEREMGYLFYQAGDSDLQKVLQMIKSANPEIRFTNL